MWPVIVTSEALPQEPKSESETTNCIATTAISDSNVREQIREKISCLLRRPRVPMHFPEPSTSSPSSSLPQSSRLQESQSIPFKEGPVSGSVGQCSGVQPHKGECRTKEPERDACQESGRCSGQSAESGETSDDSSIKTNQDQQSK